jgi:hypothetical protein
MLRSSLSPEKVTHLPVRKEVIWTSEAILTDGFIRKEISASSLLVPCVLPPPSHPLLEHPQFVTSVSSWRSCISINRSVFFYFIHRLVSQNQKIIDKELRTPERPKYKPQNKPEHTHTLSLSLSLSVCLWFCVVCVCICVQVCSVVCILVFLGFLVPCL